MKNVDRILAKLAELVSQSRYEPLETEGLEIKPVPSDGGSWKERYKTVNAFLNTRGGILILGVSERQSGNRKFYEITGYREDSEPKIKEMAKVFSDKNGTLINVQESMPQLEIKDFLTARVAVLYIDELPLEQKYCYLNGEVWLRRGTGDHKATEQEISRQEKLKEEMVHARELKPEPNTALNDINLDQLNEYISILNRQIRIESLKPTLESAKPFLVRKGFLLSEEVTTLGMLVCGFNPEDRLNFRAQVHGYVQTGRSNEADRAQVARDRKIIAGNILPLMEGGINYIYQNIQVGIRSEGGGKSDPEYPEELIRETVNNALAHRDYSIDRYVCITIIPGVSIEVRNPGSFTSYQLIEAIDDEIPIRRIIPDPKPRNPKLAQVLMVYSKWEGRGIGMATLTNLCLNNKIDLPYYRFYTESDIGLFLCSGKLLDDGMVYLFRSFDAYMHQKLGHEPSLPQSLVLAYLIKSELANVQYRYTITLTPDNNHFDSIRALEQAGLIQAHGSSKPLHPIYVADRILMQHDYRAELELLFGDAYDSLDEFSQQILGTVYRYNKFSKARVASAKSVSFNLYFSPSRKGEDVKEFDLFYRRVRYFFNKLQKAEFLVKQDKRGYLLNETFRETHLC